MKKTLLTTAFLALSAGAFAQNVAIVNGKNIPQARMETAVQQIKRTGNVLNEETMARLKQELIAREVFMQEAEKIGLAGSDNFKNQLDLARQAILVRELMLDFQAKNQAKEDDLKAEYDKLKVANTGKEFKARHILVDKEDEAKQILARLKKGEKFDAIAKKTSKDVGSGSKGGDLDWALASSYVKEFSEALVKLDKGQLTQTPVKSQFGWHVIKLDDTRTAKVPEFKDLKPQLEQQFMQQKLQAFQQDLLSKAKVE